LRLDQRILERFKQLTGRAQDILESKQHDFRSSEGVDYYKIPYSAFAGWSTNALSLVKTVFGEESVHYQKLSQVSDAFREWESEFANCKSVFEAALEDYEGGYLFNVRGLIKAEVLDDALEQARALQSAGYKDPACVVAGVSLEVTLKELCARSGIGQGKADKMNVDLAKSGAYNVAKQKQITAWADLRNKAAHGQWDEYSAADVEDMIEGINRFIADFL
jgi:hypothetical protein